MGVGWRIEGLSKIERASAHGGAPAFDASDVYMLDGQRAGGLRRGPSASPSCLPSTGGTHTTRIESYRRITQNAGNTWTVTDRDGTRYDYFPDLSVWSGTDRQSRDAVPLAAAQLSSDTHNNTVTLQLCLWRRGAELLHQHDQLQRHMSSHSIGSPGRTR